MSGVLLHEFRGKCILVVEADEGLAEDLRKQLKPHGASVLGPLRSISAATALTEIRRIDAAILDVKLDAESAFFLAEALDERNIPFVFVTYETGTGYQGFELGRPSSLQMIGRTLFGLTSH